MSVGQTTEPALSSPAEEGLREELEQLGLWQHLADPELTDLLISGPQVFVTTLSRGTFEADLALDPTAIESLIASIAAFHDLFVEPDSPILEATLPFWAIRVEAVLPPASEVPLLALRKPPARAMTLEELVERGTLTPTWAEYLRQAVRSKKTLAIGGGTGSGKTTVLVALLEDFVRFDPEERLVILEEGAREVHVTGEAVLRLLTAPHLTIDMRRLVRTALRLNPDRIIVGEVRGAEAHDWIKSATTGHPGSLCTVHASSAEDVLYRLDDLVQEAGVPSQLPRIVRAVDVALYLERQGTARRVVEVAEVVGVESAGLPLLRKVSNLKKDPASGVTTS